MDTRVIRQLCRGRTADSLPPELRRFATTEGIDLHHAQTDTQAMAAIDPPEQSQEPPKSVHSQLPRTADRVASETREAGQISDLRAQEQSRQAVHRHIQSNSPVPLNLQPQKATFGGEVTGGSVPTEYTATVAGPTIPRLCLRSESTRLNSSHAQ